AGGRFDDAIRLGRSEHDLNFRRMPHDPRDGDAGRGGAGLGCNRFEGVVEGGMCLTVPQEDTVEEAFLEWRPCLEHDPLYPAVVEKSDVAVDRLVEPPHVGGDALCEKIGMGQAELDLIEQDRLTHCGLEKFD